MILGALLRLRTFMTASTYDIEKSFWQVSIGKSDQVSRFSLFFFNVFSNAPKFLVISSWSSLFLLKQYIRKHTKKMKFYSISCQTVLDDSM